MQSLGLDTNGVPKLTSLKCCLVVYFNNGIADIVYKGQALLYCNFLGNIVGISICKVVNYRDMSVYSKEGCLNLQLPKKSHSSKKVGPAYCCLKVYMLWATTIAGRAIAERYRAMIMLKCNYLVNICY